MTKSRSDCGNAAVVIGLLRKAFADGLSARDFAIATPYQSQYEVYRAALIRLRHTYPDATEMQVQKIDGYQGSEARYLILDVVSPFKSVSRPTIRGST